MGWGSDNTNENARLRLALQRIVNVEPKPLVGSSTLDVTEWANALDEAQRIARDALDG